MLRDDLDHDDPVGPHWDYGVRGRDEYGNRVPPNRTQLWRIFPGRGWKAK